jgi:hypothetical protein
LPYSLNHCKIVSVFVIIPYRFTQIILENPDDPNGSSVMYIVYHSGAYL